LSDVHNLTGYLSLIHSGSINSMQNLYNKGSKNSALLNPQKSTFFEITPTSKLIIRFVLGGVGNKSIKQPRFTTLLHNFSG